MGYKGTERLAMVSAILLAAGKSERMGRFKQLLPLGGKTFIECCVENLLASPAGEVIVVTGHNEQAIRRTLEGQPIQLVHNPDYELGMATSIVRGFRHISRESTAGMIALADQPTIPASVMDQLIIAYRKTDPLILVPTHRERRGHPIIISRQLASEVESMDLSIGLRQVLSAHASGIECLEVET
ncbi:MAG TPA: nucleotidyltransferase family protein, partial [Blastocatellia bacterium]